MVDFPDALQHAPRGRSAHARAQQRVHYQRGVARFGWNLALHLAPGGQQHGEIRRRIALQFPWFGQQHHVQPCRTEARVQLTRDHQAIAAVVALPAKHHDALLAERSESFGQKLHHAVPGIFHQDDAGDAGLDGPPVDLAHFRRGQDLHKRRATTMVISSCNSPAPVQCTTASMVRAISSVESALEYFTSRSLRRSSPNISPYTFSGSTMPSV